MNGGKPDNLLRRSLTLLGRGLYRAGLANLVIGLRGATPRALLYHAVEDTPNPYTQGLNVAVSPDVFCANLDYFQKHYNVVPISTVGTEALPRRALVITFDDGYASLFEHALPALSERGLPACIYLIGRTFSGRLVWVNLVNWALRTQSEASRSVLTQFDDLSPLDTTEAVIERMQTSYTPQQIQTVCTALTDAIFEPDDHGLYLTAEQVRTMQAHNIEFGFHTQDHYNLERCNASEITEQFDDKDVSELLDSNTFAYPFGYFNTEAVRQLMRKDYQRIMTVGNNNRRFCRLHVDRTEVFTDDHSLLFAQIEVVEPVIAWLRSFFLPKSDNRAKPKPTANSPSQRSENTA